MTMIKGWGDAVVGWSLVKGRRHTVYDRDRAVVMWERRGMSHQQATHVVALAMHTRGARVWVRPASEGDLLERAERLKLARQMRKLQDGE
jgi:hypothetical protein